MSENTAACETCKGCPDCGPASTKRTPDAISARLGQVSDGPWIAWDRGIGYEVHGPEGDPINVGHRETFTKGDAEFIAMAPGDVYYLLTLARKQAAALEAVEVLADWPDQILTKPKGDKVFHVEAHRIRAAIRAALGAGE